MNTIGALLGVFVMICQIAIWIIIAQVIASWLIAFNVVNVSNQFVRSILVGLDRITAPIYRPIRRFLPDLGGIDLSPMIVILVLIVLQDVVPAVVTDLVI